MPTANRYLAAFSDNGTCIGLIAWREFMQTSGGRQSGRRIYVAQITAASVTWNKARHASQTFGPDDRAEDWLGDFRPTVQLPWQRTIVKIP
jgi:hypothetical protein